jgi:hypothetical protein
VPNVPAVPVPAASVPVRKALTDRVSPLSRSVSLVSTLPVPFAPAVALAVPPASTAVAVSSTPTGGSLTGLTFSATTSVAVENALVPPLAAVLTVVPAAARCLVPGPHRQAVGDAAIGVQIGLEIHAIGRPQEQGGSVGHGG